MYNYNSMDSMLNSLNANAQAAANALIWGIISIVLAVIGGIVLYFTFLSKKNEGRFKGFWGWMYDFLTFKKMMVEELLRVLYLIFAIAVTLSSFAMIGTSFLGFILSLVFGNVVVRLIFELILVRLVICRNTTSINTKLSRLAPEALKKAPVQEAPKAEAPKADEPKAE